MRLQISHTGESSEKEPRFMVICDGKPPKNSVALTSPGDIQVGSGV